MTLPPTASPRTSVPVSMSLLTESPCRSQAGEIYSHPLPQPTPGYETQPSAGRSLFCSTSRDVGWIEEVLGEANKYRKLPAGSERGS